MIHSSVSSPSGMIHSSGATLAGDSQRFFCRRSAALILIVVLALFLIAQRFAAPIDSLQSWTFPLFAALFWFLPRTKAYRPPLPLLGCALFCWAFAALNVRGYLSMFQLHDRVVLSPLREDPDGSAGRELYRRYNIIAQAYGLPKMDLLVRDLSDTSKAKEWLKGNHGVDLLIRGTRDWLLVSFSDVALELAGGLRNGELPSDFAGLAAEWKLPLDRSVRAIHIDGVSTPLLFGLVLEDLPLPSEPTELSRHYLGWLARAVGRHTAARDFGDLKEALGASPEFSALQLQAFREDALAQMTMMLGAWKSPEPIAQARLLLGSYQLAEALHEISANKELLYTAIGTLQQAQRLLRKQTHPELISLIRNNAAIARLFEAESDEDYAKARHEFFTTAAIVDSDGVPTLGARLAMFNMINLEQSGLL